MRTGVITRQTAETNIQLKLNLDGQGLSQVNSGNGFMDHMLTLFAKHGNFDLELDCQGDTEVDFHHSAEDIGICLGLAVRQALGDKRGIVRYGSILLPMDEALVLCAVDLSGRGMLCAELLIPSAKIGTFDSELVEEFLLAVAREGNITLHVKQLSGSNSHHIVEAVFKAVARALRQAVAVDEKAKDDIPSTKGILA